MLATMLTERQCACIVLVENFCSRFGNAHMAWTAKLWLGSSVQGSEPVSTRCALLLDMFHRMTRSGNSTICSCAACSAAAPPPKIMRFVRHLKLQPGYDPNTTHVVYGQVSCPQLHRWQPCHAAAVEVSLLLALAT